MKLTTSSGNNFIHCKYTSKVNFVDCHLSEFCPEYHFSTQIFSNFKRYTGVTRLVSYCPMLHQLQSFLNSDETTICFECQTCDTFAENKLICITTQTLKFLSKQDLKLIFQTQKSCQTRPGPTIAGGVKNLFVIVFSVDKTFYGCETTLIKVSHSKWTFSSHVTGRHTVFENIQKSLILQQCERSELCLL